MFPKMSEEKTETPVMIVSSQDEPTFQVSQPPPKPRSYRKYVIIAVAGIVVAAIILTAILVGVYFSTEAQKEIVKFSYNRGQNTKGEVISDPNTNIVQYHINNPDYEVLVINDFNRDIQVMKIQTASGTNCYVAPLNRTIATDPSKISAPSNPNTMKQNATYHVAYQAASTPIPDSSFLCKTAKDACNGVSTYWVYPRCEAPKTPSSSFGRHKRGWCFSVCVVVCVEYCP